MRLQSKNNLKEQLIPWISSILLLPVVYYFVQNNGKFNFVDYVNLLIHEGGHGIFSVFGQFVYVLGGTIMQLLIPGLFVFYYLYTRRKIPAQLSLIWLGENFMNVAVYAADARAHKLPLLGGNKVYHDWTYLLTRTGLILQDEIVGDVFRWIGISVLVFSLFLPIIIKKKETAKINLDL